jgi:hypothetical protein
MYDSYMGFRIYEGDTFNPWRGVRYGVSVSASTKESLLQVIRLHCKDREDWIKSRKGE